MTECSRRNRGGIGRPEQITLDLPGGKPITLAFDAEDVTSDSGLAALGALDARLDLLAAAMRFVEDLRSPDMIVHPLDRLLREAVLAYVAGYGDACDHAPLARDPLFTRLVGPTNAETRNPRLTEAVPLLEPIIVRLKEALPGTRIRVRADSGFMDPEPYDMLERHGVEYAIRLRMNATRLHLVTMAHNLFAAARRVWLHASRNWPWRDSLADVARRFAEGRLRPTPLWDAG